MFYHLSFFLKKYHTAFNLFHYVSVRAMAALLTSLAFSFLFGNTLLDKLSFFKSKPREFTPANNNKSKHDVPTMGGIFIVLTVFLTALLWCNLADLHVWLVLLALLLFALIGFWDDWNKIFYRKGISATKKFSMQILAASLVAALWYICLEPSTSISFPFIKSLHPSLGILFILWSVFVLLSASNAVNLTDGLDGLAIGSLIYNFGTFAIISYLAGHLAISLYLQIPFAATSELAVLCATFVGASLGFLWYNTYPAQVFMGDVGSLALGAALGLIALMTKQELLLMISGGLFVLETVTVILQVAWFKLFKKRIFKMAPIHHHFELLGWPESKITVRFAIISFVLCLLALMTLKIR
ncbi:phospho-N-acetylmuramoyl-pentapeptide-transferase [candidate division TM6 bacterium RIFCSPHIGHO2_12_FULL_32_22]|nr:MAG: phospho-N-acetylmuramoyl-pentapeptide-transferase [candidate division TM6 bacterium RIFCSPHIGHO2_12_FULL_32_22]